ncbi:MAG TPA: DUF1292 domain-containing protein [Candidatus Caccomorpha excrementavium]|nr:DUF1292 domain-containing protein [Candidatus Caccomorpha excrementavium]
MEKKEEVITFRTDDGEEVCFEVIEQTRLNGVDYLLVAEEDGDEEEGTALILKDGSLESDSEAVYEIVEDEEELALIASIFEELLEDTDLWQES